MYNKERQKLYYKKNKERIVERQKAYYQENKEKIAAKRKAYYEKNKKIINKKYKGIKIEKLIPEVTIFEFVCPYANQKTARELRFGAYMASGCNTMCYVDDGKVELYVYKPEDNGPIIKYLESFLTTKSTETKIVV